MGDRLPTTERLSPGAIVADRYRVEALLGEGGMGVVYLAEHVHMRKRVALKVLLNEWSNLPDIVARFEREAIAAGKIEHPNVARATDFGRLENGSFFLVLEHIDGRTLRDVVAEGALAPARAIRIARGMAAAIDAAHAQGIVHRDLKPENVMLVEQDGDTDFVKVLDFGIAKVDGFGDGSVDQANGASSKPLTRIGAIMGTPDYMSPEQAFAEAIDLRSDLYSLGVILFEMLSGGPPFRGDAASVLRQHVTAPVPALSEALSAQTDPRVEPIVRRLLEKERANRFQTARELIAALDQMALPHAATMLGRSPLHSVSGVTTPNAAPAKTGFDSTVTRFATTKTLIALSAALASVLLACVVVVAARPHDKLLVASSYEPPSAPFLDAIDAADPPPPVLPPTPAASALAGAASQAKAAPKSAPAKQQPSRRTGPGGIYIPPPSQWFK